MEHSEIPTTSSYSTLGQRQVFQIARQRQERELVKAVVSSSIWATSEGQAVGCYMVPRP